MNFVAVYLATKGLIVPSQLITKRCTVFIDAINQTCIGLED